MREPTHSGEKIGMGATRWGSTTSRSPTSWSSSSPSPWRLTWTWWFWRLATTPSASCSSLETWNVDAAKVSGESSPSLTLQLWIENDNHVSRTSELSPAMQIAVDFGDESFANGIWDRLVFTIPLVGKISSLISLLNYLMHSYLTIQCKWRRSSKLSLCIVNVSGRVSVHNFVEEARNFVKIYFVSTVCNIKFYLNCQTNMRPSFKCSL